MRRTTIVEKLSASIINALIVFVVTFPLYLSWGLTLNWKLVVIIVFFTVELLFFLFGHDRDIGMRVVGSTWQKNSSLWNHLLYNILYTLSFSSVLFYIWFPFDLFLLNMICLQFPVVLMTGTTFHGYVARLESMK